MEQLIMAILKALEQAGLPAAKAISTGMMPRLQGPVTAVCLEKAKADQMGFFQYLGILDDPEKGLVELYGRQLEATVLLDTFCPISKGSHGCIARTQELTQRLLDGIDGIQILSFTTDKCRFDPASTCFRQEIHLQLKAYLYCVQTEQEEEFTDFTLKGEWK